MANSSIVPFLYEGTTVEDIIKLYSASLRLFPASSDNLLHANMLEHYSSITEDNEFCIYVQRLITTFYYEVCSDHLVHFKGRKKGLISLEDKCNMQIFRQNIDVDYSAELNDSLAFRMIIAGNSPEESVFECYKLMNKCIDFFFKFGFTPVKAEQVFDTEGFDKSNFTNLYVPENSLLSVNYLRFVKDYIFHPKTNGYQSLHILFADALGRVFEVQIRSIYMDSHAEKGLAQHSSYKNEKYETKTNCEMQKQEDTLQFQRVDTSCIDITKISANFFILTGNPKTPYHDEAGIFTPRVFLELSNF